MDRFTRQLDFLNPATAVPITLIGAGGIGSHVGLCLAKMGLGFTVYDPDTVEQHNLSNQLYSENDLGSSKVLALARLCREQGGVEVVACPERYDRQRLGQVVISGVDSLSARRLIWRSIIRQAPALYIDARMGGEQITIYVLSPRRPDHAGRYAATIAPGITAEELPCTGRAIAYNLFVCAGMVGKVIQSYLAGKTYPNEFVGLLAGFTTFWAAWPEGGASPGQAATLEIGDRDAGIDLAQECAPAL